jgi:hypothetical protein
MRLEQHLALRLKTYLLRGEIETLPSAWQWKVGGYAMRPVTLSESERERRLSRSTWLGQVPIRVPIQLLYNPRQLVSDTGIQAPVPALVKHLLSVFHEDAFLGYDLQLLASHDGGLSQLAREAERVASRRSRLSPLLSRLVGDAGYHARLVSHAEKALAWRFPDALDLDPRFASLTGFARFCATFPDWPPASFYGFDVGGKP